MFAKLTFALCVLGALAAAPAAAGDGPMFVTQGGVGVVSGTTRYIPVNNGVNDVTLLLAISTKDGTEMNQIPLVGSWGLPSTPAGAEGLSLDGKKLVLADTNAGLASPSMFMVVNPKTLRITKRITLKGYFSFDAMSPGGSKLYFIQYVKSGAGTLDLEHYVVRGYDVKAHRLLPGRIADRTQKSWVMQGSPVTRTTSADGRWVYTLYSNPAGYPFIHALDTERGVAHCVGIPMTNQSGIYNIVLGLRGKTLSVHWRSGRPFVNVDTATWKVTAAHRGGFPWWTLAFVAVVPLALLGGLRRRRAGKLNSELAEILREESPEPNLVG